MNQKNYPL